MCENIEIKLQLVYRYNIIIFNNINYIRLIIKKKKCSNLTTTAIKTKQILPT